MSIARPRRSDYVHFQEHSTRWSDNDVYGHLNNVVHYMLFDSTVNCWLIERTLLVPSESSAIGLVVETGCRYHGEMRFPQVVTAGLRVARLGTSSVRYDLALFPEADDFAAADGFFVHVYVNAVSRRPCPIPPDTRSALEGLLKATQ